MFFPSGGASTPTPHSYSMVQYILDFFGGGHSVSFDFKAKVASEVSAGVPPPPSPKKCPLSPPPKKEQVKQDRFALLLPLWDRLTLGRRRRHTPRC